MTTTTARPDRRRRGFTLIELLVAMTILSVIVLAMTRIMADSSRAVQLGYQQTFEDSNARAVLDTIADDLTQAIVAPGCEFEIETSPGGGGSVSETYASEFICHKLRFRAALGPELNNPATPAEKQTIQLVEYDVTPEGDHYNLRRSYVWGATAGSLPSYPLMDYVVGFQVRAHLTTTNFILTSNPSGSLSGPPTANPVYTIPPISVDVMLMTLSDQAHIRAMSLSDAARRTFIRNNAKRHFLQINLPTQSGHLPEFRYKGD